MEESLKQKFYENYSRNVLPKILDFEPIRRKYCRKFVTLSILNNCLLTGLFIFTIMGLIYILMSFSDTGNEIKIFVCFIIAAVISSIYSSLNDDKKYIDKKFNKEMKKNFLPFLLACFENMYWSSVPEDTDLITNSNLFTDYNEIVRDDTFIGIYKNVKFAVEEIKLNEVYELEGKIKRKKRFKGIIFCINLNKKLKSNILIYSKHDDFNVKSSSYIIVEFLMTMFISLTGLFFLVFWWVCLFLTDIFQFIIISFIVILCIIELGTWITTKYKKFRIRRKVETIKLEDTDFNKKFTVQSSDQIEARYIMTPAFMERLKNIQTTFGTQNIKCSFFDDKIMFAISTDKDLFEIGDLHKPLENESQIHDFYNQIISIYEMIDYFKLAEKTGL